ncbi:polysaccharide biosynthesis protein [Halomonas salinarum]|uniref:polysaccharide biosynthesis protein n=1 Tax=Halomonas salinarum TaxID=1158993 RepID=UPI00143A9B45|nr:nucleoside-diphosphate sugar epimerase/dehydratase [Halomonas salinarum]
MSLLSLNRLFRLPRKYKRIIQVSTDIAMLASSYLVAMLLRVEDWGATFDPRAWIVFLGSLPFSMFFFINLGFYRAVIRYIGEKALINISAGIVLSATVLAVLNFMMGFPVPQSVAFIYAMLALISVGGIRFFLRSLNAMQNPVRHRVRVAIYGAGQAGSQLASSLRQGSEYTPVAYIDDWKGMHGTHVEGLKVYPPSASKKLIDDYGIERILLAMPSAPRSRRRDIFRSLESLQVSVQTVPGMADVVAGRARINDIRDVALEDLLGRDPVPPDQALMAANIRNKVVMVTGAGGSIGSELCRQILRQHPRELLLFEISEFSLYQVENELLKIVQAEGLTVSIRALLGSVQNRARIEILMRSFGVQTIYHAAAYKHVPMVEHNIVEGVLNNVFGTLETVTAAIDCRVETFVLVSTDKAVRPTNVMGTTKRIAELICQAATSRQLTTRFCIVRFGNVLGSSGSVVPLFRKQISLGGPITVTHPEITRYFMTIPEAAQLVIQAGGMGRGGDVFVLDMGEPIKIAELARQMIRLSGLDMLSKDNPVGDIEITYSGLRHGEKLFEELLLGNDISPTAHPRIMTAQEEFWQWPRLNEYLHRLHSAVLNAQYLVISELLQEAPTDYHPLGPISDITWQQCSTRPKVNNPVFNKNEVSELVSEADKYQASMLKSSVVTLAKGNNF